jgi:hypothetical protein
LQRREAALRLVAFMMQPEITNRWSWTSGYLPVAPDPLAEAALRAYLEREPRWRIPVEQMTDTVITTRLPGQRCRLRCSCTSHCSWTIRRRRQWTSPRWTWRHGDVTRRSPSRYPVPRRCG